MRQYISEAKQELAELCDTIRIFVWQNKYEECEQLIFSAMGKYPHAPEPHNLIGIVLEKKDDHLSAMKHFRAACALDPAYIPARFNLDYYGSFFARRKFAFNESDCSEIDTDSSYKIKYDENGIGHAARRK